MEQSQCSLYDRLKAYGKQPRYPFHMPGHKLGRGMDNDIFSMDITEITGFDNLHQAQGIIREAEQAYANAVGAKETFFLINGASCGLIGALLTLCWDGDEVVVGRNCHKSVWDGLVLSGAAPHFILPERAAGLDVFGQVDPQRLDEQLNQYPNAKGVLITSPTFEGVVSDIAAIADVVHWHGMLLVVDEAHGAHFSFCEGFPQSAVKLGADIVVQSAHKTLAAPTQTALLHVASDRVDVDRLRRSLRMTQSTSPSYVFLAYLDRCRMVMEKMDTQPYWQKLQQVRQELSALQHMSLFSDDAGCGYDVAKLVLTSPNWDMKVVAETMRDEFGVEMEFAMPTHICYMTSPFDADEGFEALIRGLKAIDSRPMPRRKTEEGFSAYPAPKTVLSPRQAAGKELREVPLDKAVGEIAGQAIIPYPPGIPLVFPGEELTEEIVRHIEQMVRYHGNVLGIRFDPLAKISIIRYDNGER